MEKELEPTDGVEATRAGDDYFGPIVDDTDDRKLTGAVLAGEKHLLEMVAWGAPLPTVLNALCSLVEATEPGCHCGILFFNPAGTAWQQPVGPSLPSGYNQTMHGRPAHRDSGPCGLAAFLKAPVVVQDVLTDTRWDNHGWRTLALTHGLRSCWSAPILSQDQQALGALAIYQTEPGSPTPFQAALIRQLTHIASIAVERARSEAALKRSQTFLAEAQRLSATGSFSWHVATNEITWSQEAHRIFEFAHGVPVTLELIGSRLHPEDKALLHDMLARVSREEGDFEYEPRLQMPDGSVKYLHLVAHGARGADDQLEYIGAVQDVTKRSLSEHALGKLRSELAHMSRVASLGALTASIAHEVNQPLSGIITNASTCLRMLASEPPNVDGARETARRTIRDGSRASDVITRLRALFTKKEVATERVNLNEATREVIALSGTELHRSQAKLRTEFAADLPQVFGDRVQLQQVVLNLLLNALDAMSGVEDRPKQLTIRTEREPEGQVRLTVRDTGVGIEAQAEDRLFDAFYTTKNGGMGMGLSVSRSIIENHQGRLWAAPNDGPGTAFSFSIPSEPLPSATLRKRAAVDHPAVAVRAHAR